MSDFIEVTEDVTIIETDGDHVEVIESSSQAVTELSQALSAHKADVSNPHAVTKAQVGLGSVDNTPDASKPVSAAQQAALDGKANFPNSNSHVPQRDVNGNQSSLPYTSGAFTANTLVQRTGSGAIFVGPSSNNAHAAQQGYVDAADALRLQISDPRTPIRGTGFPNGVVIAPVGSIYIDTAATNGAISWIKASGTGNTGWVVEYGDTGWRNITSTAQFGWGAVEIRVRRVNENVYWGFEALSAAAMTNIQFMTAPVGFGFSGSTYADRQFLTTAASPAQVWRVTMINSGAMQVQGSTTSVALLYGSLVSTTTVAWPTTLPGTAL